MAVPSPQETKSRLRKETRSARMHFVARLEHDTRHALEEQLADRLSAIIAGSRIVAFYHAIGSEVSLGPCIARARRLGKTVAYPAFDPGEDMFKFRAGDPVMPGPHQIMQPLPDAPVVSPDLVLMPLVACGDRGVRIGQGKGHYDRVIAKLKGDGARLIGTGWHVQRLQQDIPAEEWDIPLDAFACPRFYEEF